jgi:copper chaperone CopZ
MKNMNSKVLMMLGLMIMVGIMVGAMIIIMLMFSQVGDMGQMVFGTSVLNMMIIPMVGLIVMVLVMIFFYRKMVGGSGPMSMMTGRSNNIRQNNEGSNSITLNYRIPEVSCGHCKTTIEHEVGKLSGVLSVNVDVDSKQATIKLALPPTTKAEIETLLANIGYPPESQ